MKPQPQDKSHKHTQSLRQAKLMTSANSEPSSEVKHTTTNKAGIQLNRFGTDYVSHNLSVQSLNRRQFLSATAKTGTLVLTGGSLATVSSMFSSAQAFGWGFIARAVVSVIRSVVVSIAADFVKDVLTNTSNRTAYRSYQHLSSQGFSTPVDNNVYKLTNESSAILLQHDDQQDVAVVFQAQDNLVTLSGPVAAAFAACGEVWPRFIAQQQGLNISLNDALLPLVSPNALHIGGSLHKSFAQPMHYTTKLGSVSVDYAAPSAYRANGLIEIHVVVSGQEVFWDRFEVQL